MNALKQSLASEVESKDSLQLYTDNLRETLSQIHDPRVLLLVQNEIDHSLVHIAEASSKATKAEMGLFDGDVPRPSSGFLQSRNSSEPGACRLV